jgi:osmotically-inducible protein OsmY
MDRVVDWLERVAAVKARIPSDAEIAGEIGEAIARRTSGANRISVEVRAGAVTLRGNALTSRDRCLAAQVAATAKGAWIVVNDVQVAW